MKFYLKKPVRIDYYPKTKEDIDELEGLKIEDDLDKEVDCEITDEKESIKEEITKCNDSIVEDVEVMEKGIEKVEEEVVEDKKEN